MKTKSVIKYYLNDLKKSALIYYLVILLVNILNIVSVLIVARNHSSDSYYSSSGSEMSSIIFIFILGLCTFKEYYLMFSQNGVSRKTHFIGWLCIAACFAACLAIIDSVLTGIMSAISAQIENVDTDTLFHMLYGTGGVSGYLGSVVFNFTTYLAAMTAGYFITIMYYRLQKMGKIMVSVCVPGFFIILLPIIETYITRGAISRWFVKLIDFAFGLSSNAPYMAYISFIVIAAIAAALSWLLVRKVAVKSEA